MPVRNGRTAWNGGLQDGSGQVELTSSKAGTFDVDFPKRASDSPEGQTSPEELIAAAHSACFAMSLSNEIGQAGGTPHGIEVDGLDEAGFRKAAEAAENGCPVSKALAAIDVTVEATLAS